MSRRRRVLGRLADRAGEELARVVREGRRLRQRESAALAGAEQLERRLRESGARGWSASAAESRGYRKRLELRRDELVRERAVSAGRLRIREEEARAARRRYLVARRLQRCLTGGSGLG